MPLRAYEVITGHISNEERYQSNFFCIWTIKYKSTKVQLGAHFKMANSWSN